MPLPLILAEVSDNIPGKGSYLVICIVLLIMVSAFASRDTLGSLLLEFTILGAGLFLIINTLILDPNMRKAILAEQGRGYFVVALGSLLLPLLVGVVLYLRSKPLKKS